AHVAGDVDIDSLHPPLARLAGALRASSIGGSTLDSGRAAIFARDSMVGADSLHVWGPASLHVDARGAIRLTGAKPHDSILINANTDSLALIAPLLVTLAPGLGSLPDTVTGAVTLVASAHGSPKALVVRGAMAAPVIRWGVATVRAVRVIGQWSRDAGVP